MSTIKVSYCILTYNQEDYIEQTIQAAFNQTYSPMEIIISDDGSTDHTFEIVQRMAKEYKGPNVVKINQNVPNLGLRDHYNKVLYELSTGEYIILADGDDVSISTRVEDYVKAFEQYPDVVMVSSKSIETDQDLNPLPTDEEWDGSYSINTINDYIENPTWFIHSSDSRGLRRSVIDAYPPLKYPRAEDLSFFIRALMVGSECYIRKGYVHRRHHDNNSSSAKLTKDVTQKLITQMNEDVDTAHENGYISIKKVYQIKNKFLYILEYMNLYSNNTIYNLKVIFYKALSKVLKVRIFKL